MNFLDQNTTLRRSNTGNTFHLASCRYAANSLPWIWAEGKTRDQVSVTQLNGLHPCGVCKPLDALPVTL